MVSEQAPTSWEEALLEPSAARPTAAPHVYSVDSAIGCFMDLQAANMIRATPHDLFEVVTVERENPEDQPTWLVMTLQGEPSLNIVAFSSGWGDGAYPTYIAYTRQHEVARIVTDFQVL